MIIHKKLNIKLLDICNIFYLLQIMWGNKKKVAAQSKLFDGENVFTKLTQSSVGRTNNILKGIFTPEEMKQFVLPKIIVVGDESAGKSSLLENITKCQLFPRDSKLCTKFPIHLKTSSGPPSYSVSYIDYKNNQRITRV